MEGLNQTRMAQLFNFAISRKSLALVDPLAERAIFDEQQVCYTKKGAAAFFKLFMIGEWAGGKIG